MGKTSDRRGWTFLFLKKIAVLIPYILDLIYILGCAAILVLGADMFKTTGEEIDALIEAGDLPMCVKMYPLSLFAMTIAAVMLLIRIKRR